MKPISHIFFAAILLLTPFAGYASDNFKVTSSMHTNRMAHTATLLPDGKVLVAGGSVDFYGDYTSSAELYDPTAGTWKNTGSLNVGRQNHTATLLPNGKVLVAGGDSSTPWLDSAELYNPLTQKWSLTKSLHEGRELHTATLLPNGEVLVAGGYNGYTNGNLASAELYNGGSWTQAGSLNVARWGHSATLLGNGMVLVAGGAYYLGPWGPPVVLSSAELYNPYANKWFKTGSMAIARWQHTATLLSDGEVLVVGGRDPNNTNSIGQTAELYNPVIGKWRPTNPMKFSRYLHTATLLKNGQVLVAGGDDADDNSLSSAEIYEPYIEKWQTVSSMNESHEWPSATLLLNGSVLIAGGIDGTNGITSSAGIYDFPSPPWTW